MIGYRFIRGRGCDWRVHHHGALIPMTMPHALPRLPALSSRLLAVRHLAPFVRWEEEFDQHHPTDWWHVVKDTPEALTELKKKTRYQIRKSAKVFFASSDNRTAVMVHGYKVYRAAFDRYTTFERMLDDTSFKSAIQSLPRETEFWTVWDRESNQMVGFSENTVRDNACFYNTMWLTPEALKRSAGYLLFHEMNKHYLNDRGLQYVSDGARNISHQTRIHEFLESKFGFRKAYSRLRIVYFPGLGLVLRLAYPFRSWFSGLRSPLFQKIEVLLEQERIRLSTR